VPNAGLIIQVAIGIIFSVSAASKWIGPARFSDAVSNYKILPNWLSGSAAILIMFAETWFAFAHLTGYGLGSSLSGALLMLALFAFAVSVNLVRGRDLSCYCFGHASEPISVATLFKLLLIAGGESLLFVRHSTVAVSRANLDIVGIAMFWALLLLTAILWMFDFRYLVGLFKSK